jgi:hypothetical protein
MSLSRPHLLLFSYSFSMCPLPYDSHLSIMSPLVVYRSLCSVAVPSLSRCLGHGRSTPYRSWRLSCSGILFQGSLILGGEFVRLRFTRQRRSTMDSHIHLFTIIYYWEDYSAKYILYTHLHILVFSNGAVCVFLACRDKLRGLKGPPVN